MHVTYPQAHLRVLMETDCSEHVLIRDLLNADRIQCGHTQMKHLNYRKVGERGWKGAGRPTKEPHPMCPASRCTTRLLHEGRTSNSL